MLVPMMTTVRPKEHAYMFAYMYIRLSGQGSHLELIVSCLLIGQFEFDFVCITIGANKRQSRTHRQPTDMGCRKTHWHKESGTRGTKSTEGYQHIE